MNSSIGETPIASSVVPNACQIVDYMRDMKGISFDLVSEEQAREFLEEKNFYFKVKAFAKNYEKYNDPSRSHRYVNLDFGHLVELSRLDKALRSLALLLTLDIEHYLKVRLDSAAMRCGADRFSLTNEFLRRASNRVINSQLHELDGTAAQLVFEHVAQMAEVARESDPRSMLSCANSIVRELNAITGGGNPDYLLNSIEAMRNSPYSHGLVDKYGDGPIPYWVLLELITFGNVVSFYKMCFGGPSLVDDDAERAMYKRINPYLRRTVSLRNAAAHSDCLLNGLAEKSSNPGKANKVVGELQQRFGIESEVLLPVKSIHVAMDLAATVICYDMLIPEGESRRSAKRCAEQTAQRFMAHADWFRKNYRIDRFLTFADVTLNSFASAL